MSEPEAPSIKDAVARELEALRAIVEGTATSTGDRFFQILVENLCRATGASRAFIAGFTDQPGWARTIAYFKNGALTENIEWELEGTPCKKVVDGDLCHYPRDVSRLFPKEVGIESYLGVPLQDANGQTVGHLAILDTVPMPENPRNVLTFRIFAARAVAELERIRVHDELRLAQERYRDLFDEAPIAYVMEDIDSNFVSANQTALRTLGLRPDEVKGMRGKSLAPDTPDAQKSLQDAFASVEKGIDTSGVVLELRRKDTGAPVFIQWWSRPEIGNKYTRTMFIDITDRILLERKQARLQAQNQYLQEEIRSHHNFHEIIGSSRALEAVLESVERVAGTDVSVLVQGETGTGKELIARAIHATSTRRDKPLIKVNCAALPQSLIESELFGHEKGAFTGALTRRIGRFELADGGTIFLDEVGEMPLDVQVKLLRVLQEREIERVGSSSPIPINVRVIAATNRDLRAAIKDKTFREDLFYRLNVFPVHTPPLRDRVDDLPLLAQHMIRKFCAQIGKRIEGISGESMRRMQAYGWPGNVRELQNVIERAVILADSHLLEIELENAPPDVERKSEPLVTDTPDLDLLRMEQSPGLAQARETSLEAMERQHIVKVLEQTNWVIEGAKGAARALDMHASTLRHRMQKLGISRSK